MNRLPDATVDKPVPAPAPKPRAAFSAASFANLRAAAGEEPGGVLRISLASIDEDGLQPRTMFDSDALELLADSIKLHGVVQPIVVQPASHGRYTLLCGARRVRASTMAGMSDIPAVIRAIYSDTFALQVVENQQRANLSNSDLAAAIARLADAGATNRQIAVLCALKDYQVATYRQADRFPQVLRERMNHSYMRALYDLYRQWGKTPAQVIAALPDPQTFITVTEARRIIADISGKPTGSIFLDRISAASDVATDVTTEVASERTQQAHAVPATGGMSVPESDPAIEKNHAASGAAEPVTETRAQTKQGQPVCKQGDKPVFIVALCDGQTGRLVVDQRAARPGWALVAYPTGIEEVEVEKLRIVRID